MAQMRAQAHATLRHALITATHNILAQHDDLFIRLTLQVKELRTQAEKLPDDYLVVLVGDMITEEGLPTYMTMLNTLDGVRDETGASDSPWAKWTRAWTAEENRHGAI